MQELKTNDFLDMSVIKLAQALVSIILQTELTKVSLFSIYFLDVGSYLSAATLPFYSIGYDTARFRVFWLCCHSSLRLLNLF